ncbi:ATP-binding cassette domain-containing protein [Devosia nitrariae]|uniref:ATP-binding cassette domain-containing protein n=1 Tax=Devosia nitrariae TaxID=2071872 RepID=UPI0024E18986|nr:ATP-binding cassette domain-containing protein [Devosia nitrariae]
MQSWVRPVSSTRQNPAALSGGQQQRVGIGRAMSLEADLMLFDDPPLRSIRNGWASGSPNAPRRRKTGRPC